MELIDQKLAEIESIKGYDENDSMGISGALVDGVIHGLRHPPEPGKSGWYVWQGDLKDDVDFFKPTHTYHVTKEWPVLKKYFQLPAGYRFLIDTRNNHVDIWFDKDLLNV